MSSNAPAGLLLVVSAPSATGKTTVVEQLVQVLPGLRMSRSYTSRPARPGEEDGLDYNFITRDAFEAMIARDAFLEWADVFGHYYGTGKEETQSRLAAGEEPPLEQRVREVEIRGPPIAEGRERVARGIAAAQRGPEVVLEPGASGHRLA